MEANSVFTKHWWFQVSPKSHKYLGYNCLKIRWPELWKIAQSVHTVSNFHFSFSSSARTRRRVRTSGCRHKPTKLSSHGRRATDASARPTPSSTWSTSRDQDNKTFFVVTNGSVKHDNLDQGKPTYFLSGRITVRLTSSFICLVSAALLVLNWKRIYLLGLSQTSQTGGQSYRDFSPCEVS